MAQQFKVIGIAKKIHSNFHYSIHHILHSFTDYLRVCDGVTDNIAVAVTTWLKVALNSSDRAGSAHRGAGGRITSEKSQSHRIFTG